MAYCFYQFLCYASYAMAKKTIIEQVAAQAKAEQAILSLTVGSQTWRLPITGKAVVAGDYAFMQFPNVEGLYFQLNGNLQKANTGQVIASEEVFFPDRAEELKTLQQLAKKHGYSISKEEGGLMRSPRGQGKPKAEPRDIPAVGDQLSYSTKPNREDAVNFHVVEVNGKELTMKAEDDTEKTVTYNAVFWRYHKPVSQSKQTKDIKAGLLKK